MTDRTIKLDWTSLTVDLQSFGLIVSYDCEPVRIEIAREQAEAARAFVNAWADEVSGAPSAAARLESKITGLQLAFEALRSMFEKHVEEERERARNAWKLMNGSLSPP